jgi:hypothetical protein
MIINISTRIIKLRVEYTFQYLIIALQNAEYDIKTIPEYYCAALDLAIRVVIKDAYRVIQLLSTGALS